MAHRGFERGICRFGHEAMADRHKMLGYDTQARFWQQKVDVGHAAMQRIFNGYNRGRSRPILDRINGVFERKTGQG